MANIAPIYKKEWKDDPENYSPVRLTLVLGKVMEQIIMSAIAQYMQHYQDIKLSQDGFMKGRSFFTNLISLYNKVNCLVDEGRTVDVLYLDFRKAFDTVPCSILLEKFTACGVDRWNLLWVKPG